MPTPYSTHVYEEVTSTQDVARELPEVGPVLVVASRQTAGRGRSGASWETAPRALAMSLRFDPFEWPSDRRTLITLATGIAVARVRDVDLKWPNDLLLRENKVGGILAEASGREVTIGIGLNLWWPDPPSDRIGLFPEDPGPSAYAAIGFEMAEGVWTELAKGPERWSYDDYCDTCITLGRQITWGDGREGTATAIDRFDGALIVEDANGTRLNLKAGEIRHVRASPDPR